MLLLLTAREHSGEKWKLTNINTNSNLNMNMNTRIQLKALMKKNQKVLVDFNWVP